MDVCLNAIIRKVFLHFQIDGKGTFIGVVQQLGIGNVLVKIGNVVLRTINP